LRLFHVKQSLSEEGGTVIERGSPLQLEAVTEVEEEEEASGVEWHPTILQKEEAELLEDPDLPSKPRCGLKCFFLIDS
jgi:hypothetical protein